MRPWQHAKSSAGKGGDWLADLPIHEFMDSTKAACPDLRHRMILHNADLGPQLAARAFPDHADSERVAMQHVREDLGFTPTLADWLGGCDVERLPKPLYRRLPLALDKAPVRVAGDHGSRGTRAVLAMLTLPVALAGPAALSVLCNGMGPAIARVLFGPPHLVPGHAAGPVMFDPAYEAEKIIQWFFGTIPPLVAVVSCVRVAPATILEGS